MPLQPFATAQDVAERWRALTPDEEQVAMRLIVDACDMIRSRWPDVDDRLAAGRLTALSLQRVVAQMVKRAMIVSGSEGVENRSQVVGPFQMAEKYANPNANLYLTREDVRLLDARQRRTAFAVDLAAPPVEYW